MYTGLDWHIAMYMCRARLAYSDVHWARQAYSNVYTCAGLDRYVCSDVHARTGCHRHRTGYAWGLMGTGLYRV